MGNSTIIEINNDFYGDIFKDKTSKRLFLQRIQEQLASGKHDRRDFNGYKIIGTFHRTSHDYAQFLGFLKLIGYESKY